MSVRVMSLVWALELPDSEKIVLLALADCANDEGHCWPGMKSLVKKCSKSDRTIQTAIQMLCTKGHLTRREVPGKGCNYTVHPIVRFAPSPDETHYLYRTEDPLTGEFYVGARSVYGDPGKDEYLGSGEWVKLALGEGRKLRKTVLETFESRDRLAVAEQAATAAVFGQELCRNRKIATPETLTPRDRLAPKGSTSTPEAASGKPSRTVISGAKAPSAGAKSLIPNDWKAPLVSELPPRAKACAEQWTDASYQTEAEAFLCYWRSERRMKGNWRDTWVNRIISRHSAVMRDQKFGNAPKAANGNQKTPAELREQAEWYDRHGMRDDAAECRRKAALREQAQAA